MADELSLEAFAGASTDSPSPPLGNGKGSTPATEMSFDDFAGKAEAPSLYTQAFDKTLKGLKATGGEAAALADLVLGIPGFLIGTGAQLGGTIQAKARGVPFGADQSQLNPVTAYTVGREAGKAAGEPFSSPVKKVLDLFKSGEAYEQAKTTAGMNKLAEALEAAGRWAEEKSGGAISRDAVPMLAETLMAGATGIGSGKAKPAIDPAAMKRMRESIEQIRTQAEADAKAETLTPQEFVARAPVSQQINDMLGIRSPAEQAKITRQRRKEIQQAFRSPAEESDFGSIEESQFKAEERLSNDTMLRSETAGADTQRLLNEAPEGRIETVKPRYKFGQKEVLDLLQKPPAERTSADIEMLGNAAKRQKGEVSQDAMGLLAAAGLGTTAGALLDDEKLRGAVLGGMAGLGPALLMRGPGKVASRFGQAGAVKGPGGMWHPEAVERLSDPLWDTLRTPELDKALSGTNGGPEGGTLKYTQRLIKNYLNKYAGTEKDPLKDVEIPAGNTTATWGELSDLAVSKTRFTEEQLRNEPKETNIRPNEDVFTLINSHDVLTRGAQIPREGMRAAEHIQSYLSHVGDYLRQNVKPEELPRYDLVRAVRETAENDKRVAKQMEKAQGDSTKTLPVHKAYPDGFKWVELKLPEKLTEEQAKTVKPMSEAAKKKFAEEGGYDFEEVAPDLKYVAVDAAGKPVQNSYTNDMAVASTPEKAWLAGRLAEEGNTMGHCVGGYCEGVASGESKIYSLRDAKGKSHVTIETGPTNRLVDPQVLANHITKAAPELHGKVAKMLREAAPSKDLNVLEKLLSDPEIKAVVDRDFPTNIDQIKGKQNRAPNAEYLPYVQDFVRSGKWGEVQDLQNTGLKDLSGFHNMRKNSNTPEALALFDKRYVTEEEFNDLSSGKLRRAGPRDLSDADILRRAEALRRESAGRMAPVTPEDLAAYRRGELDAGEPAYRTIKEAEQLDQHPNWRASQRGRQEGKITQDMVVGLTGLGLGGIAGWAMSDDPSGALLGALAGGALGIPAARGRIKTAIEALDWGLGSLSTRIGEISPALKLRGREYERNVLTKSHAELHKVVPFMQELNKLPTKLKAEVERAILSGDSARTAELIKGNQPLVAAFRQTKNVLADLGGQLQGHGRFKTMLDDYFPRLVKDVEGLKAVLGTPERTKLESALMQAEATAMKNRGTPLTSVEQSSIINREIEGFRRSKGYQPGYAKQRGVEEITKQLQPFYHTASESLYAYIRGAIQDLELAKFFGRDLTQTRIGSQNHTNLDGSIGNLVGRELAEGNITHAQAKQLDGMLKARFRSGDRSPNRLVQEVRNVGNMGLLGNVVSAVTQLSDTAMAIYAQDLRSTLTAIARQLSGNEKITVRDFGLADHIAEEFVSQTKTADWLNKLFKYSGFSAIDRFGKNTHINAALSRAERLSRTPGGVKQLEGEYGKAYGAEFPRLVDDLKNGRMTERVRSYLFSELSDMQPVSKMELPQGYLENPNGRLMYMLKSFMLKQIDVMRRDSYNEIKKGNVVKGLKNLTEYALVLGIAGATTDVIKDWIMGRDVHFDTYDVLENALKTFGWSEYVRDKAAKGKPMEAVAGMVVPPYRMMDEIIRRDPKAVQYVPIIGKLYYSWELGGKEAAEIARAKKSGAELSEGAKQYRREQREKKRANQ